MTARYPNADARRRIRETVKRVEATPRSLLGPRKHRASREDAFWGEITAEPTAGVYTVKRLDDDGAGGLADTSPLVTETENVRGADGVQGLPAGVRVFARLAGSDGSGAAQYVFESPRIGQVFRVQLADTSGSDGDTTTAPTYVYTATLDGNTVATGLSPEFREIGSFTAATRGIGAFTDEGFVLLRAYEQETTTECS